MYSSQLLSGEHVIDGESHSALTLPRGCNKGYEQRDRAAFPQGFSAHSVSFDVPLIPRSEWPHRIKERESNGANVSALLLAAGIPSLNQQSTNYCWCNAVVGCFQAVRSLSNEPYKAFSPASVAAPVKGFWNTGGWGGEALHYIAEHGICTVDQWPANAIAREYDNDRSRSERANYKVAKWFDLDQYNFDQVATLLLMGVPVAAGLNWWGHEVMFCDLVAVDGGFGVRFRNSWGDSYGSKGFNVLTEHKANPDDACAVASVTLYAPPSAVPAESSATTV